MISGEQCQVRARDHRIAGFKILSRRDRMIAERDVQDNEYPTWVRVMDRLAGVHFAEAERWLALANGPAWKRWFR